VSVRVSLSKAIYPRECLEETVVAYSDICSVKLTGEAPHALEVEITAAQDKSNSRTRAEWRTSS
jgi:hypothetical protein